jgi:hypothetical protein
VFPDRWLALVAAAVLPDTGRDPLFRLATEPDASGGYGVALDDGAVVGHLDLFDEPLEASGRHERRRRSRAVALVAGVSAGGGRAALPGAVRSDSGPLGVR